MIWRQQADHLCKVEAAAADRTVFRRTRPVARAAAVKFRIATYNVHKCKGLDGRVSVKRIADVLSEINADVDRAAGDLSGTGA